MTRDRVFHRTFWPLMLLLVMQNAITLSVNLLDNVMLGGYSESALAGAASANQIFFVLQQLITGIADGLVIIAAQYWGQQRTEPIQRLTMLALCLAFSLAFLFFSITAFMPAMCIGVFTKDAAIIAEGAKYLRVVAWSYPVFAITAVMLGMLRSVETVRIAVVVSALALCSNGLLNYAFIYGRLGAPELGSEGAAIATLISRILECAVVLIYVFKMDKKIRAKIRHLLFPTRGLIRDYFRTSLPTMVIGFQWGLNNALQTVILGHLTVGAIAANAIATNLMMMLKVVAIGAAAAAGLTIGKAIGIGVIEKVKEYARSLQIIFLGISLLVFAGIQLLRGPILSLYNISENTMAMAWQFLSVMSVTGAGMAYQMPTQSGVIRGGGDTRFVMMNDMISIWGIVMPVSLLAAFVWNWPPWAVVACLQSDQVFKCLPAAIKVNNYTWIKRLTRKAA